MPDEVEVGADADDGEVQALEDAELPDAAPAVEAGQDAAADGGAHEQDATQPDAGSLPEECAAERVCAGDQSRCLDAETLLVCSAGQRCGQLSKCWYSACGVDNGAAACEPATRLGAALVNPRSTLFLANYVDVFPYLVPGASRALGVGVHVDASSAKTRAVLGVYAGIADAHGPRPGALIAQTGVIELPPEAGEYSFQLQHDPVSLEGNQTCWLAATYETDRNTFVGDGAESMFYRGVPWTGGSATLPADLSPFFSSKTDNAPPAGLYLVVDP